ncbi:MAG: M48 family metallopeptidase [Steroidobacter sp.]
MSISARYFDGRTSTAHAVQLSLFGDGRFTVAGDGVERSDRLSDIRISERVGDTTRRFQFSDGAVCEIADNDLIDQWLEHLGAHSAEHRVFRLERRWQYALAALILTVASSWAFIRYGVPAAADYAARALPRSADLAIGKGGLEALDALVFEPSRLSMAQQTKLHAQFDSIERGMNTGIDLRFELRSGEAIGANAFALPSGIIVMTDELVELAEHPEEIESVLAHEVGHIVHRHSLRMLLQSSASALLMFTLLGDVNSASTLAASVPTVLVQAKHSRDFEREADEFSFAWLKKRGIQTHRFGDLLKRIEQEHRADEDDDDSGVMSYFSSHPQTRERSEL